MRPQCGPWYALQARRQSELAAAVCRAEAELASIPGPQRPGSNDGGESGGKGSGCSSSSGSGTGSSISSSGSRIHISGVSNSSNNGGKVLPLSLPLAGVHASIDAEACSGSAALPAKRPVAHSLSARSRHLACEEVALLVESVGMRFAPLPGEEGRRASSARPASASPARGPLIAAGLAPLGAAAGAAARPGTASPMLRRVGVQLLPPLQWDTAAVAAAACASGSGSVGEARWQPRLVHSDRARSASAGNRPGLHLAEDASCKPVVPWERPPLPGSPRIEHAATATRLSYRPGRTAAKGGSVGATGSASELLAQLEAELRELDADESLHDGMAHSSNSRASGSSLSAWRDDMDRVLAAMDRLQTGYQVELRQDQGIGGTNGSSTCAGSGMNHNCQAQHE
eukprot:366490-Chlamydomonas_euryale.AAC.17